MKQQFKQSAQAGFTLIELIVVIVILGILAATALPRFMDMGADARVASVNAATGSLRTTAAAVRGAWMVRNQPASVTMDGLSLTIDTASGYPEIGSAANFVALAGLDVTNDYIYVAPDTTAVITGATRVPATGPQQFAIIPRNASARGNTCNVVVTLPTTANGQVTVSPTPTAANC